MHYEVYYGGGGYWVGRGKKLVVTRRIRSRVECLAPPSMSIGGGGCYHFGGDNVHCVSCGSPRFLGGFLGRRNGVLPHHVANASLGFRHHVTRTIGETHRLTLLPCMASVVGWRKKGM